MRVTAEIVERVRFKDLWQIDWDSVRVISAKEGKGYITIGKKKSADRVSGQTETQVIRFVGENEPLNVGKLKKIIVDLDDDFTIDMRVRTKLTDEQLKDLAYPYPYNTEYTQLEFDDIGYSDKQLCLGCEIANKHV